MNELFESLSVAATAIAIFGSLFLGLWCAVLGHRRRLVLGLVAAWALLSAILLLFLVLRYFHEEPPRIVEWLYWGYVVLGLGLFAFFFHIMVSKKDDGRDNRTTEEDSAA